MEFGSDGIANVPRKIKPLRSIEPLYKESRDPTVDNPAPEHRNTEQGCIECDNDVPETGDNGGEQPEMCEHPLCILPKHPESVPHKFADEDDSLAGGSGRNAPRRTRGDPDYREADVRLIMEDVTHQALLMSLSTTLSDVVEPKTYEEAIGGRFKERWLASMNTEIEDLMKHGTWELVRRSEVPRSRKITKSRWVYKIKINKDGSIERFKSRFVVCGYSQVKGVDYVSRSKASIAIGNALRVESITNNGKPTRCMHTQSWTQQTGQHTNIRTRQHNGHPMTFRHSPVVRIHSQHNVRRKQQTNRTSAHAMQTHHPVSIQS